MKPSDCTTNDQAVDIVRTFTICIDDVTEIAHVSIDKRGGRSTEMLSSLERQPTVKGLKDVAASTSALPMTASSTFQIQK